MTMHAVLSAQCIRWNHKNLLNCHHRIFSTRNEVISSDHWNASIFLTFNPREHFGRLCVEQFVSHQFLDERGFVAIRAKVEAGS